MSGVVEAFADHALSARYENLTESAQDAVKTFILDSIGVGIAGANSPLSSQIRKATKNWSEHGNANVWGSGNVQVNSQTAAFLNGFQIHCQEFDCVHERALVHPMATILSAIMADIDQYSYTVSGPELAVAIAVAVDLSTGIGSCVESPLKFFRPANAGLFGAVLGISRLRRFNVDQVKNAMGYALAFNAGTMQAHHEGKPALPIQIANAARNAIAACDLAENGIEGPIDSLEGKFGYFALFEDKAHPETLTTNLGETWKITELSHKPFPTGRAAQGGIVLMQDLRSRRVTHNDIEKIWLDAPPLIERLVGRPVIRDMSPSYARLCFQYLGALALMKGYVELSDFEETSLRDSKVLELGNRIEVKSDGSINESTFTPQKMIVCLKNGRTIENSICVLYGSPSNPMSKEDQLRKFRNCVNFGFGQPSDSIADKLIDTIDKLEKVKNVSCLSRLANGQEL